LNLCYVAAGRFDAFWAQSTKAWDIAAGILLVTEAGGVVSHTDGGPLSLDVAGIAGTAPVSGSDSGVRVDGSQVITTGDGVQIVVPPAIPAPTSTVFSGLDSGSVGLTTDNANSYLSPAFLNMVNGILSGGAAPSAPAIPSMRWPTLDSGPSFLAPSRDEIMNSGGGYHYISPAEYGDLHLGGFDSTLVL